MRAGPTNSLTDVAGLRVGHATRREPGWLTGTTVVLTPPGGVVCGVDVRGGGPGTRETDALHPHNLVDRVDAVMLGGGSAMGLAAADGIVAALLADGRGWPAVEPGEVVPIVPGAILFDLINGGTKDWGRYPPYRDLGFDAVQNAGRDFTLGSNGAGTGALTAGLKGGLGSASTLLSNGVTVGALAAVNALGVVTYGSSRHFRAAAFEIGDEFGGLGLPHPLPVDASDIVTKINLGQPREANTTITVIATDAVLTKAECKRLAVVAHDGFAHAIWPSHTPMDGDIVFALATGTSGKTLDVTDFVTLCASAVSTMARAIARGVYSAQTERDDVMPVWKGQSDGR